MNSQLHFDPEFAVMLEDGSNVSSPFQGAQYDADFSFDEDFLSLDFNSATDEFEPPQNPPGTDTANKQNADSPIVEPSEMTRPQPPSQADWNNYQATIKYLYTVEDKELKEIMKIMEEEYKFFASEKQYRRRFARWQIEKKVKAEEMRKIMQIQQRRALQGKSTAFSVRNRPVSEKKIDRFKKKPGTEVSVNSPAWPTPPWIEYHTPQSQRLRAAQSILSPAHEPNQPTYVLPSAPPNGNLSSFMEARGKAKAVCHVPNTVATGKVLVVLSASDLLVLNAYHTRQSPGAEQLFIDKLKTLPFAHTLCLKRGLPASDSLTNSTVFNAPPEPPLLVTSCSVPGCSRAVSISGDWFIQLAIKFDQCFAALPTVRRRQSNLLSTRCRPSFLELALHYERGFIFKILVLHGLNVDTSSQCDTRLLQQAQSLYLSLTVGLAEIGNSDLVGFLCRVQVITHEHAKKSLFWAALDNGHANVLEELFCCFGNCIFDLDEVMEQAMRVRSAISSGHSDAACFLVYFVANSVIDSTMGASALHLATILLLENEVEKLIAAGADINQRMYNGESALHILSGLPDGDVLPLAKVLVSSGADVHAKNLAGDTCLHNAVRYGRVIWAQSFVEFLLQSGADINATNEFGQTCLSIVASTFYGKMAICMIQWLQDHGADGNIPDSNGNRPCDILRTGGFLKAYTHCSDVDWLGSSTALLNLLPESQLGENEDLEMDLDPA